MLQGSSIFTPSEASFYLAEHGIRLSAERIRALIDTGKLAARITPTGRRLVALEALEALVAERQAKGEVES